MKPRTAIEECIERKPMNWTPMENTRDRKARAEFRALMASVRWLARQGQFTYAESTDKTLARLRRLGLIPARKVKP